MVTQKAELVTLPEGEYIKYANDIINKLKVGKKIIGLMKKAVGVMTNMFIEDYPNIDPEFVFITHTTECDQSYAEIDAKFKELGVFDKVTKVIL